MPLYIEQIGDLDWCHGCLTHSQTLKDRATQLLIKNKSGALVMQKQFFGLFGWMFKSTGHPISKNLTDWSTPE